MRSLNEILIELKDSRVKLNPTTIQEIECYFNLLQMFKDNIKKKENTKLYGFDLLDIECIFVETKSNKKEIEMLKEFLEND